MSLTLTSGNLLDSDVDALVNTVNTVGVMGKGIALQFKQAFPENFAAYQSACRRGEVVPGRMFVTETAGLTNPRFIINFPTKRDWRAKARLADVDAGLDALIDVVRERGITSLAVPPLGCGNGGLDWNVVRPRIEAAFAALPDVRVLLFTPDGAPDPAKMTVATSAPNMTPTRAALLGLFHAYTLPGYRLSMLEMQKLTYFLQEAGEPMNLQFEKEQYGPYAETLHHIIQRLEGHYVRGYGDRSKSVAVEVLPEAEREADLYIEEHPDVRARQQSVAHLIEGFETPRGLELLATVHWVARENPAARCDWQAALDGVTRWSDRKRTTFPPEQIKAAWGRLKECDWLPKQAV